MAKSNRVLACFCFMIFTFLEKYPLESKITIGSNEIKLNMIGIIYFIKRFITNKRI